MPASDTTLYASWELITYDVSFAVDGGSPAPDDQTLEPGSLVTEPTAPSKTGYTFTGWFYEGNEWDFTSDKTPTSDITIEALYAPIVYQMTFDANGGSNEPAGQNVYYASLAKNPGSSTKTGYTFTGWYDDGVKWDFTTDGMPAGDVELSAGFDINEYTISFDSNEGSDVSDITQDFGTDVTEPGEPTLTGYTFAGWYSDSGLSSSYTFSTMPASDTTLYAKWEINQYTISFDSNDGSLVSDITQDYDTAVTKPTDPTKSGYTLAGWYSDSDLTSAYTFSKMPGEDTTLYAKWTAANYTVRFYGNGGSGTGSITDQYGHDIEAPTSPTRTGYTFSGWFPFTGDETVDQQYTDLATATLLNGSTQYWQTFKVSQTGALTKASAYIKGNDYWVDEAGPTEVYAFIKDTSLGAPSGENLAVSESLFIDKTIAWKDFTFTQPIVLEAGHTYALYVSVVNETYQVKFYMAHSTNPYPNGCSLPNMDANNDILFKVSLKPAGLPEFTFPTTMPAGDTNLSAAWTANQYTISFEENDGSTMSDITQDFDSTVTKPTDPTRDGYTFAGWYSDEALTSAYTFSKMPSSDTTVYAKWTAKQYTLSFDGNGGSSPSSIKQDYGTSVTAPTDPTRTGYSFNSWYTTVSILDQDIAKYYHYYVPVYDAWQTFSVSQTARLEALEISIGKNGGSVDVVASIYETDEYGDPTGSPIATSAPVTISNYNSFNTFRMTSPIVLEADTLYAYRVSSVTAEEPFQVVRTIDDSYMSGAMYLGSAVSPSSAR